VSDVVQASIVVASDPDSIMDVIADFESYPEWQEEMKEVEVLQTDEDGWGTRVRFKVDARIARASFVLRYTYGDNEMRWILEEGDQVTRNDGAYVLTDQGDGSTHVSYELEIETSLPLPKMVRRQAAKRISEGALAALKKRVEGGA
jgi:ribosome-associated toxin RatA of RatAB toxin-antitoxin module